MWGIIGRGEKPFGIAVKEFGRRNVRGFLKPCELRREVRIGNRGKSFCHPQRRQFHELLLALDDFAGKCYAGIQSVFDTDIKPGVNRAADKLA